MRGQLREERLRGAGSRDGASQGAWAGGRTLGRGGQRGPMLGCGLRKKSPCWRGMVRRTSQIRGEALGWLGKSGPATEAKA